MLERRNFDMIDGVKLKSKRAAAGIPGNLLCKRIGIARSRLSDIERGYLTASPEELEIHFFAAQIAEPEVHPLTFEQIKWVLPKELSEYDFLAANRELIAHLTTGKIKPAEVLENS